MTRLKYNEVGNLLYTNWITLGPNYIVRAIINTETFHFQIIEFNTDVVFEGSGKTLRESKSLVKKALAAAGANFSDEIRKR